MTDIWCAHCGLRPAPEWRSSASDRWIHWAGCGVAFVVIDGRPVQLDPIVVTVELPRPDETPIDLPTLEPAPVTEAIVSVETAYFAVIPPPPPLPEALVPAAPGVFSFNVATPPVVDLGEPEETDRFSSARRGRETPRRVPASVFSVDGLHKPMEVDTRRRRPVDFSAGVGRMRTAARSPATSLFARDPDQDDGDELDMVDLVTDAPVENNVEADR